MEVKNLKKFYQKSKEDLNYCLEKISKWNHFRDDYIALEERLTTITDTTRHDIMVPIGGTNVAFMPASIKHTNEILVLLGDNYFVERSAKQAIDIIKRRVNNCDHMIESLNKEKENLQSWLSFTQQFSETNEDLVEIIEEYDEEKEAKWREERQRKSNESKMKSSLKSNVDQTENIITECETKTILKQSSSGSSEKAQNPKSVSFDDNVESIPILNETEEYPNPKYANQSKPNNDIMPTTDKIEAAFKNIIIERNVSESEIPSSTKSVSRFKAERSKK